jgi:hypothetical protein
LAEDRMVVHDANGDAIIHGRTTAEERSRRGGCQGPARNGLAACRRRGWRAWPCRAGPNGFGRPRRAWRFRACRFIRSRLAVTRRAGSSVLFWRCVTRRPS